MAGNLHSPIGVIVLFVLKMALSRGPLAPLWRTDQVGQQCSMQSVDAVDGLIISVIGRGLIKDCAPEVELDAKDR